MTKTLVLMQRALREAIRTPDALLPVLFIPLFFLVVNVGQVANVFPSDSTAFLEGQTYGAFQLPASILLAASFGGAALFLVEDIEGGYFDKLRSAPVPRFDRARSAGLRSGEEPGHLPRSSCWRRWCSASDRERCDRVRAAARAHRRVVRHLLGVPPDHGPQDPQRGRDHRRAAVLPPLVPHARISSPATC